jgi:multidrug efflux pump subunit AcrA (membrane-fusion protein)
MTARRNLSHRTFSVLAAAAVLTACAKKEDPARMLQPPTPPVQAAKPAQLMPSASPAPVEPPPTVETLLLPEAVAELQGMQETPVLASTPGYLVSQDYREGVMVGQGDLLFVLDTNSSHADPTAYAKNDLGLVKIRAPTWGRPGRAVHGLGDKIEAGEILVTIATIDPIRAVFFLPADFYRDHKAEMDRIFNRPTTEFASNVELRLPEGAAYGQKGKIVSMVRQNGRISVVVEFRNPDHFLHPGEFAKVRGVTGP